MPVLIRCSINLSGEVLAQKSFGGLNGLPNFESSNLESMKQQLEFSLNTTSAMCPSLDFVVRGFVKVHFCTLALKK